MLTGLSTTAKQTRCLGFGVNTPDADPIRHLKEVMPAVKHYTNQQVEKEVKAWVDHFKRCRENSDKLPNDIIGVVQHTRRFNYYDALAREQVDVTQVEGAFPVFRKDTLQDVLRKYCNVFSLEVSQFMRQLTHERQLMNENGWSGERSMRKVCDIPENLYSILDMFGKINKLDFLRGKGLKAVKELLPKLFIGGMRADG